MGRLDLLIMSGAPSDSFRPIREWPKTAHCSCSCSLFVVVVVLVLVLACVSFFPPGGLGLLSAENYPDL